MAENENIFLVDNFMEEGLDTLGRQQKNQRTVRVGADVVVDLQTKGPLYEYIKSRRYDAKLALVDLVNTPAEDSLRIAKAQAAIVEYLRASEWVNTSLANAEMAEEELNGEQNEQNYDE